jgi:hypothetical protein
MLIIKQLYYTLIYPYLTYGVMSWGNAYIKSSLTKVSTIQNKCLRSMFFAESRESATPYYLMEVLKVDI